VGSDSAEEFLRICHIPGDVIVPEDDDVALERGIFRGNFGYRPVAELMAIHDGDGAEIASARTSPGRKEDSAGMVVPVEKLLASLGNILQGRHAGLSIHTRIRSYFKPLQELFP